MKKIILMTMLMGAVFAQRRMDWEGANFTGANLNRQNLEGLNLKRSNFAGATLEGAILEGVRSSRLEGKPASLPKGWSLVYGRLIKKDGE